MDNVRPWHEIATLLVDVAMGRRPADLVVRNGRWVNVHTREVIDGIDLAVCGGRLAAVGPGLDYTVGPDTTVIEAQGQYLVPGLLDGHMHVESSMLTVTEYVRAVLPRGTTGIFADPHEIANVLGLAGVRLMRDEAAGLPVPVHLQVPSCVPSAPGLERPGASLSPADVAEALTWPGVIGLGEMMNFPGVSANDPVLHAELAATARAGKVIGGHYASPDLGRPFWAYLAGGPADDHEGTRELDAVERARRGMRPMLRLGSAWFDVEAQITAVTRQGLDPRSFILCTDDVYAGTLVNEGHMDRVLRHAVGLGLDPLVALQMMTLNTAQHFGVDRDQGSLTPGRRADVVLTPDLRDFQATLVLAGGQVAARDGRLVMDLPAFPYPAQVKNSVKLSRAFGPRDFELRPTGVAAEGSVRVNVIGIVENQAPTRALVETLTVRGGVVQPDPARDICRLALVERHHGSGDLINAFVHGFQLQGSCAVAGTVAHDSHHLLVMGTDTGAMAAAVARLAEVGGGVVVIRDGREAALVELPIAGLMSDERAEVVARKSSAMVEALRACGCTLNNAYMQFSLLALVVIPELRLSDLGLVDVRRFAPVGVVVD